MVVVYSVQREGGKLVGFSPRWTRWTPVGSASEFLESAAGSTKIFLTGQIGSAAESTVVKKFAVDPSESMVEWHNSPPENLQG